ncbi:hypothetical protein JOC94_001709 [Bacillus thermophilus]|uniref:Uncharacterized protein n=1 Tax=Siminovitchia thermophila TaxID=1245522 RepID=A0ABS2R559_9BACI|nr:hypothetical protein [Siminovitchia thermophila]MBM7714737.1 hypothetical protein [Siminovitchia thermophila]
MQQYFYRSYQCPAINANTLVKVNKVLINRGTATDHSKRKREKKWPSQAAEDEKKMLIFPKNDLCGGRRFYPENSWKANHAIMYERWEKSYRVLRITLDNDGFDDGFSQKWILAGNVTETQAHYGLENNIKRCFIRPLP